MFFTVLYAVELLLGNYLPGDVFVFSEIFLQYAVFLRSENFFSTKQFVPSQFDGAKMIGGNNQPIVGFLISGHKLCGIQRIMLDTGIVMRFCKSAQEVVDQGHIAQTV